MDLENVKNMKYLCFTITSKYCSFIPTLENLSIKAKRVIYSLNSKIKISRYPMKLALKLFDALIKQILLYGAEVWCPYTNFDYNKWEGSKVEMTYTKFLKSLIGCNFHTSNIMIRAELGVRPLLVDVNIRTTTYIKSILERPDAMFNSALEFERNNEVEPNFLRYTNKFNVIIDDEILGKSKNKIKRRFQNEYNRYWHSKIMESPKALSPLQI